MAYESAMSAADTAAHEAASHVRPAAAKKPSGVVYEPATVEACRRDYEQAKAYRDLLGNFRRYC